MDIYKTAMEKFSWHPRQIGDTWFQFWYVLHQGSESKVKLGDNWEALNRHIEAYLERQKPDKLLAEAEEMLEREIRWYQPRGG